jgi:cytosine/adenosine deaminase-related metal-dependent hydrolase
VRFVIVAANATVGVADGRIVEPVGPFDAELRIPDGELRPGLINAHDHLHRNHYGRLGRPPYANSYQWGTDIHDRDAATIACGRRVARRAALLWGAWKNLIAGVTTVVHHDAWESDFEDDFPIRVARLRVAHSLGLESDLAGVSRGDGPFAIHLAEGTDRPAADEVRQLAQLGLLSPALLAVHVVGADPDGIRQLRESGAAIVWCPSSNYFLFGRTAPAALLAPGIDVVLGSDSLLTGAGSLLDELRVARCSGIVSDERLLDAIGRVAARRLSLPEPTLAVGAPADLAVFRRPVLEATVADVALVVVAGIPRVADPALVRPAWGWGGRTREFDVGAADAARILLSGGSERVSRWISTYPATSYDI